MAVVATKRVLPGTPVAGRRRLWGDRQLTLGSLWLIDFAHSMLPACPVAGIPSSGTKLVDVAAAGGSTAGGVLTAGTGIVPGAGTTFDYTAEFGPAGSSMGKSERSAKGGIHVIAGQQTPATAAKYAGIRLDPAVLAFMVANPTHAYYVSIWRRITRNTPAGQLGGVLWSAILTGPNPIGSYPSLVGAKQHWTTDVPGDVLPPAVQRLGSYRSEIAGAAAAGYTGPSLTAIAAQGWTVPAGTTVAAPSGSADQGGRSLFAWGAPNPYGQAQGANSTSSVAMRAYGEDLTISGRTFAQVVAMDQARYAADVLAATGKWFGDTTPTAPSAIP